MRAAAAFFIGAGTAYFSDRNQGKRRRRQLLDRSLSFLRRTKRAGIGKAKFAGGHVKGVFALLRRFVTRPKVAVDDPTVEQRIRSEALRDVGVDARDLDVRVEDGFATLSGSIGSIELSHELVERVRKVPGVRDVAAEFKVSREYPGEYPGHRAVRAA